MSETKAEKEAAKAAKEAEKEAAKAAEDSADVKPDPRAEAPEDSASAVSELQAAIQSLQSNGVFPHMPEGEKAKLMAIHLAAQPKVSTYLPLEDGEKPGTAIRRLTRNGFVIEIVKGIYVDIPKQLHEEIQASDVATKKAANPKVAITDPISKQTRLVELNIANQTDKDREFMG
jgi:hypothetical protein